MNSQIASLSGFATRVQAQVTTAFEMGDPAKHIGDLPLPPLQPHALDEKQVPSLKNQWRGLRYIVKLLTHRYCSVRVSVRALLVKLDDFLEDEMNRRVQDLRFLTQPLPKFAAIRSSRNDKICPASIAQPIGGDRRVVNDASTGQS